MHVTPAPYARNPCAGRRGFTLPELLIAMAVTVFLIGSLGALGSAVYTGNEYSQGRATTTQHARVVLERIERTARGAYATRDYPGLRVLVETDGAWQFPETLIVWHPRVTPTTPDAKPFNAEGPPRLNEIVFFCLDPQSPNQLLEITARDSDTRELPLDATFGLVTELKVATTSRKIVLTDRLVTRTADDVADSKPRGALRFVIEMSPTDEDLDTLAWSDIPWVQGVYGSQTGLRQAWVRFDMQLWSGDDPDTRQAIPFFGSAALYHEISQ